MKLPRILAVWSSLICQLGCTAPSQSGERATATTRDENRKSQEKESQVPVVRDESSGSTSKPDDASSASDPSPPKPLSGAEECLDAEPFVCKTELAITRYVNELRASQDAYTYNAKLAFVARDWSKQQAASGKTSHDGFPQRRAAFYMRTFGEEDEVKILAENTLAYDDCLGMVSADDVAKAIFDLWATSQKHRDNMLSGTKEFGVGVWKSGTTYYATQIFGD